MTQEDKSRQVSTFLAGFVKELPYFIDNDIMDSFEVTFELNGKKYQLALTKDEEIESKPWKVNLN